VYHKIILRLKDNRVIRVPWKILELFALCHWIMVNISPRMMKPINKKAFESHQSYDRFHDQLHFLGEFWWRIDKKNPILKLNLLCCFKCFILCMGLQHLSWICIINYKVLRSSASESIDKFQSYINNIFNHFFLFPSCFTVRIL